MTISKYNANGNDFLITHAFLDKNFSDLAKRLCDRHNGIGADGFVVLLPHNKYDYKWNFYNCDGSYASMCGNASMCVAHYACNNMLANNKHVFLSGRGKISVRVDGFSVEVDLGNIKILENNIIENDIKFVLLDSGVKHLVCFVPCIEDIPKQKTPFIEQLRYKYDSNINFALLEKDNCILFTTYEKGVEDFTLACGTGGAAVFYLAYINNYIGNYAYLIPPSSIKISYKIYNDNVVMNSNVNKIADIIVE